MTPYARLQPVRYPIDRLKPVNGRDVPRPAIRRGALDALADRLVWLAPLEQGPPDDLKRHLMGRIRAGERGSC